MNPIAPPDTLAARLALAQLRAEAEAKLAAAVTPENTAVAGAAEGAPEDARTLPATTLSEAGRTISRIATQPLAEAERGAALERAVLTQLGAPADALAGELRTSLRRSGLFYEAHLRAWDVGRHAIAELRREPQARIGEPLLAAHAAEASERAAAARPQASPAPAVARALEPLVREQLATLETQTAVVPLTVWPGQSATLAVSEEPQPRTDDPAAPAAHAWRARLKLELPQLGELEFSLALQGDHVSVGARARDAASRAALLQHASELRAALAHHALALERIEVSHDER